MTQRQRQGLTMLVLLVGPTPLGLVLSVWGTSPLGLVAAGLTVTALVGALLALVVIQRREARREGQPVLPPRQVLALLSLPPALGGALFLLSAPSLAGLGVACLGAVLLTTYGGAWSLARGRAAAQGEPNEIHLLLMLALMMAFIASANSCL